MGSARRLTHVKAPFPEAGGATMKVCRHGYMYFCPYNTRSPACSGWPEHGEYSQQEYVTLGDGVPAIDHLLDERGPRIIRESGWQVLTCVRMCVCGCERGLKV